ncbi:MAG: hypothetical protein LBK99_03060 [Opitutaceae bacterium]|nr:hypothetical protein [Opitutaceae bacterium]
MKNAVAPKPAGRLPLAIVCTTCAAMFFLTLPPAQAAIYNLTSSDAAGESSLNTVGHWTDSSTGNPSIAAPGSGNDYIVDGAGGTMRTLRAPLDTDYNLSLGGYGLWLRNQGRLVFDQGGHTVTVSKLVLHNDGLVFSQVANGATGSAAPTLAGTIVLQSMGYKGYLSTQLNSDLIVTAKIQDVTESNAATLVIRGGDSGNASIQHGGTVYLLNADNSYTQGTEIWLDGTLDVGTTGKLGTGYVRLQAGTTLKLGHAEAIASGAELRIETTDGKTTTIDLDFTGTSFVGSILINNTPYTGSLAELAKTVTGLTVTGTGFLATDGTPFPPVPEHATTAALLGVIVFGLGTISARCSRRQQAQAVRR